VGDFSSISGSGSSALFSSFRICVSAVLVAANFQIRKMLIEFIVCLRFLKSALINVCAGASTARYRNSVNGIIMIKLPKNS
jgi:hypothetical protein